MSCTFFRLAYPLALACVAALTVAAPVAALAQSAKPLRLIVPFPAGGTADVLPRSLSEKCVTRTRLAWWSKTGSGAGGNIALSSWRELNPMAARCWHHRLDRSRSTITCTSHSLSIRPAGSL
jgi:tripartite-type tricarboxylate transporter receptor subunit TctC